jgi:hypothetical protein
MLTLVYCAFEMYGQTYWLKHQCLLLFSNKPSLTIYFQKADDSNGIYYNAELTLFFVFTSQEISYSLFILGNVLYIIEVSVTRVRFPDGVGLFRWSRNPFYGRLNGAFASAYTEEISSVRTWKQLLLFICLPVSPGTMQGLNWALVNSMCLTANII